MRTGFGSDLIEEGIEANPGPVPSACGGPTDGEGFAAAQRSLPVADVPVILLDPRAMPCHDGAGPPTPQFGRPGPSRRRRNFQRCAVYDASPPDSPDPRGGMPCRPASGYYVAGPRAWSPQREDFASLPLVRSSPGGGAGADGPGTGDHAPPSLGAVVTGRCLVGFPRWAEAEGSLEDAVGRPGHAPAIGNEGARGLAVPHPLSPTQPYLPWPRAAATPGHGSPGGQGPAGFAPVCVASLVKLRLAALVQVYSFITCTSSAVMNQNQRVANII